MLCLSLDPIAIGTTIGEHIRSNKYIRLSTSHTEINKVDPIK